MLKSISNGFTPTDSVVYLRDGPCAPGPCAPVDLGCVKYVGVKDEPR